MAIKWRSKILLFKLEATYGTDPTPSGASNAIYAKDVEIRPMEGTDVSRDLEKPWLGADETIAAELHARITFKVELAPSGTAGTAPAWGPMLRACGVAEVIVPGTSVAYNPVTDAHESGTLYLYIGDTLYASNGLRGTAKLNLTAQSVPVIEFEFTGLFVAPAEGTRPSVDLTAFKKPQLVTDAFTPTFTIGGTSFVMRSAMLDLGNAVERRFLVGKEEIIITEKQEVFETTVEAVALTTFDPFAAAIGQNQVAVNLVHGTGAGKISTLAIPAAQMQRPQGLANAQDVKEWPLRLVPLPVAGNDQWTLTLT
ncbi:hypothetical protein FGK63_01750 [Ruegeria sediminis]|uniref:Major tail protein n=1 Tax=Ruegeria sediminis TaxID=2583820 RepID=A0ABY2X4C5_9RHOB|nr:hypothetical protein [Ruegeria sediminis]TMV09819.1 hypothetical protein FGK63_01750 [Ruegeria sediminis]